MVKIEDVEIPTITAVKRTIENNDEEVFTPKEVNKRLPKNVPISTIRSALQSLRDRGNIERVEISPSKTFYGKPETIKELRERLEL